MGKAARSKLLTGAFLLALAVVLVGCGGEEEKKKAEEEKGKGGAGVEGQIAIEGSSAVLPITQAATEAFDEQNPDVEITVGGAGTGEGFEAFCNGTTQISDTSRPIDDEETRACEENGVEFIELPVAQESIAVVVNPRNEFAENTTLEELRKLWEPSAEGEITTWNEVNSEWPGQEINLYGPATGSGAFELFTERVVGEGGASRTDYQASEDDDALVEGVAGDLNALGYFGFGYFEQNQDILKSLPVDSIEPTTETIKSGQYPLSRPLFIYVSRQALKENRSVEEFVSYYLENLDQLAEQAQYVPLSGPAAQEARERFESRATGPSPAEDVKGGESKSKEEEKK